MHGGASAKFHLVDQCFILCWHCLQLSPFSHLTLAVEAHRVVNVGGSTSCQVPCPADWCRLCLDSRVDLAPAQLPSHWEGNSPLHGWTGGQPRWRSLVPPLLAGPTVAVGANDPAFPGISRLPTSLQLGRLAGRRERDLLGWRRPGENIICLVCRVAERSEFTYAQKC